MITDLYLALEGDLYAVSPSDGECIACYQAGEETTSKARVWHHGDRALIDRIWQSVGPDDFCEDCLADKSHVFIDADNWEQALQIATRYDEGATQPDNLTLANGWVVGVLKA